MKKAKLFFLVMGLTVSTMAFKDDIGGQVVCFGDSITHGSPESGGGWVTILSKQHPGIDFVNAGRNGRKTSDRNELLPVLEKYPHADYYLVFLGVNDLKDGTDSLVNACVSNLEWMVNQVKTTNNKARIVILAPSDINLATMSDVNVKKKYNKNTQHSLYKLEKLYKKLAKKEKVYFISLLHAVSAPNYLDGLHPDLAGQTEIAETVWKGLNKLSK